MDELSFPGLAKLNAVLSPVPVVVRPALPKYNPRFDLYGPRPQVRDIAALLGEEHFVRKEEEQARKKPAKMYNIGELAKMLERKTVTIQMWIRNGTIPEADHWTAGARSEGNGVRLSFNGVRDTRKRMYTQRQVWGLRTIALEEGVLNNKRPELTKTDFTTRAFELWEECATEERRMPG
jgi:hypothetical protein